LLRLWRTSRLSVIDSLQTAAKALANAHPFDDASLASGVQLDSFKSGMSESQVVEILGPPTSVDSSIDKRTHDGPDRFKARSPLRSPFSAGPE
jgi:outer membrane protein assembly factor BamE (lipoprotein component of BamABCDE complex)